MPARLTSRALLERLVAFDTTSRDSNLHLIDFVADYLRGFGIDSHRIVDPTGKKANLWASIGAGGTGGLVLSGHTDVVPVDGQPWSTDPFVVTERDGRLYGRGTSDMKGFIACALALVPDLATARLKEPVHLAFSYDEEVGCIGVHGIIDHVRAAGIRPRLCFVGEPTNMQVVDAHKGIVVVRTTVTGLEGHSSAPQDGVNAVEIAAQLIMRLVELHHDAQKPENQDARFTPSWSTITVGTIIGGTAHNIIPRHCSFEWQIRGLPGLDQDRLIADYAAWAEREVAPAMRAVHPQATITHDVLAGTVALRPDPGSPAETLALKLAGSNRTQAVSFAAEAGIFQAATIPTVIIGPGSIREAHKPDEYIELSQLAAADAFMQRLLAELTV
jgi:acetylornithine deacetylase